MAFQATKAKEFPCRALLGKSNWIWARLLIAIFLENCLPRMIAPSRSFVNMKIFLRANRLVSSRIHRRQCPYLASGVIRQLEQVDTVGDGKVEDGRFSPPILPGIGDLPHFVFPPAPVEPERPALTPRPEDHGHPYLFPYLLHNWQLVKVSSCNGRVKSSDARGRHFSSR